MSESHDHRFGGIQRLYGRNAAEVIRASHVAVAGIGGVGSWAAEALARTGVGRITLIDMDDICVTNTNRQIHAVRDSIGQSKVEVMAARIRQINPECQVEEAIDFVTSDTQRELLTTALDGVIDAIDSVRSKAAMIAHCKRIKLPIITVGGAGGQLDPRQITSADLSKSFNDPLMAKVRSDLRRNYGFSKNPKRKFAVECVFSTEQLVYPKPDGSVCQAKQTDEGAMRLDCASGFGAATMVTATFGFVAASRILDKVIARASRD